MQEIKQDKLPDICKTITFKAPINKVWDAVSTSEGMAEWFMPNDFKAEVGHEFNLQSPFGPSPCKVLEVNPPFSLAFAWDKSGWHLSFNLKVTDSGTEFTVTHSGWGEAEEINPKSGQKNSQVRDIMNNGWEGIVNGDKLLKAVEG
jgi:uncharacterized protein YndB with AHSA1/START domain